MALGMTQASLASPLSRAFVSAVEKGLTLPSLGTLWLFAARLGTGVGDLVDGVNGIDTDLYNAEHAFRTPCRDPRRNPQAASSGRR